MRAVRAPKRPRHLPKALSDEAVEKLLRIPDTRETLGARDRAILELFYATGVRVSELVALNRDDLDMQDRTLRVRGKGGLPRTVPVGDHAVGAARHYFMLLEPDPRFASVLDPSRRTSTAPLFINRNGGRLSARSIRRNFDKYLRLAGMDPSISPPTLRHSFAARLLGRGADLQCVKERMGHASTSTTQMYTQLTPKNLHGRFEVTPQRAV